MAHPQARRLMTHPGVGWVTALGTEVFLGDPQRFAEGKAVASYDKSAYHQLSHTETFQHITDDSPR
jgi:hypothetical protein